MSLHIHGAGDTPERNGDLPQLHDARAAGGDAEAASVKQLYELFKLFAWGDDTIANLERMHELKRELDARVT